MKLRIFAKYFFLVLVAASVVFLLSALNSQWSVVNARFTIQVIPAFILCILLWIFHGLSGFVVWVVLLKASKIPVSYVNLFFVYTMSIVAKYLPGNIGMFVGRAVLAKKYGLEKTPLAISMGQEIFFSIAAPAIYVSIMGQNVLAMAFQNFGITLSPNQVLLLSCLSILGVIGLFPPLLSFINRNFVKTSSAADDEMELIPASRPGKAQMSGSNLLFQGLSSSSYVGFATRVGAVFGLHFLQFFIVGTVLFIFVNAFVLGFDGVGIFGLINFSNFAGHIPISIVDCAVIASGSILIGFLVPGAPAGLGVREVAVVFLLTKNIGSQNAILVAAIWRLSSISADFLLSSIGLVGSQMYKLKLRSNVD